MPEPKTKVDEILTQLKNHRVIAWIIVGVIILGGVASFLKTAKELTNIFGDSSGSVESKKLVELISNLEISNSSDSDYLSETITPIFEDFEIIHKQYVKSFEAFHAALSSGELNVPNLALMMRNEYLFTEHDRSKLRAVSHVYQNSLDSLQVDAETRRVLSRFYEAIYDYLTLIHSDGTYSQRFFLQVAGLLIHLEKYPIMSFEEAMHYNFESPRSKMHAMILSDYLESGKSKQQMAIEILKEAVQIMQDRFSTVSTHYAELTILLMKP